MYGITPARILGAHVVRDVSSLQGSHGSEGQLSVALLATSIIRDQ
jgi:hypothetical protein